MMVNGGKAEDALRNVAGVLDITDSAPKAQHHNQTLSSLLTSKQSTKITRIIHKAIEIVSQVIAVTYHKVPTPILRRQSLSLNCISQFCSHFLSTISLTINRRVQGVRLDQDAGSIQNRGVRKQPRRMQKY
jgi:lambda repressor-like predicted transcriptional regulator